MIYHKFYEFERTFLISFLIYSVFFDKKEEILLKFFSKSSNLIDLMVSSYPNEKIVLDYSW
jgi:hypothetical protein